MFLPRQLVRLVLPLCSPLFAAAAQGGGVPVYEPETPGAFAPLANYFRLRLPAGVIGGPTERRFHYGSRNVAYRKPLPLAGDFDDDGLDTVGIFDPYDLTFRYANRNRYKTNEGAQSLSYENAGVSGTHPICGDWDGDGFDTFGIYDFATGEFHVENGTTGTMTASFRLTVGGVPLAGGLPVAGDFDGDGTDGVGVYLRPADRWVLVENVAAPGVLLIEADWDYTFGDSGGSNETPTFPTMGDWNSDGVDTPGILDLRVSQYLLVDSHAQAVEDARVTAETEAYDNWWPVAGDWSQQGVTGESVGYDWDELEPASAGFNVGLLNQGYGVAAGVDHLHSLLVFRGDRLVREEYYNGFDVTMANNLKSASKSVLSALYGVVKQQTPALFTLNDTVSSYLGSSYTFATPQHQAITIADIMTMSSGLPWTENGFVANFFASPDWVQYVLDQGPVNVAKPYKYSTGLTHLGSALLQEWVGEPAADFAGGTLWPAIEATPLRWDRDPYGVDFGGSEIMMRPRDMGRFGLLYLGSETVPPGSIRQSSGAVVTVMGPEWTTTSMSQPKVWSGSDNYNLWWRHRVVAGHDTFYARGWGGQLVIVVPTLNFHGVGTSKWDVDQATAAANGDVTFNLFRDFLIPAAAN